MLVVCCFVHCRVVLFLYCVPSPTFHPCHSDLLKLLGLAMAGPSSVLLLLSLCPSVTLRASSHIHLPLLCLCLSICDVIPEDTDSPSWTNSGLSLLLSLSCSASVSSSAVFLSVISSWLALSTNPLIPVQCFSFPASFISDFLSCLHFYVFCNETDASGFFVILHLSLVWTDWLAYILQKHDHGHASAGSFVL